MVNTCITCMSICRNLIYISGTDLQEIYLQLLNKPFSKILETYLLLCRECEAVLKSFQLFITQTQSCYDELWYLVQKNNKQKEETEAVQPAQHKIDIDDDNNGNQFDELNEDLKPFSKNSKWAIKTEVVKKEQIKSTDISDIGHDTHDDIFIALNEKPLSVVDCNAMNQKFEQEDKHTIGIIEEQVKDEKQDPAQKTRKRVALPEKPLCALCGKRFSSRKTYRSHMNELHKGQRRRLPCPQCGKLFQWKQNLKRHIMSHKTRDSGELYCGECDMRFASIASYHNHLTYSKRHGHESRKTVIATRKRFICDDCDKNYTSKRELQDHIERDHLHRIKYKCQLCEKAFKWYSSLYVHVRDKHKKGKSGDKLCHVCGKSYNSKAQLDAHVSSHAGVRYACTLCGRSYASRAARDVHARTHAAALPCLECGRHFSSDTNRQRHIRTVHRGERRFKCDTCDKRFGDRCSMQSHVRHVHLNMPWPKRVRAPRPRPPPAGAARPHRTDSE